MKHLVAHAKAATSPEVSGLSHLAPTASVSVIAARAAVVVMTASEADFADPACVVNPYHDKKSICQEGSRLRTRVTVMSETNTPTATQAGQTAKPKRDRSPSFPFIALHPAINRLVAFEDHFKRHPAPAKHSGKAWGMKGWTSQAQQTLAALKAFGLVEYQGSGDALEASVSEEGRTYLRAQQDSIKREVLKRVALKPKNLAKYFAMWGSDRPPDEVCLDQLVLKGGFTEPAAKLFLQVYDATISYAGLAESDKLAPADLGSEEEMDDPPPPPPEVHAGDLVQRESNGALSFSKAMRVRKILEDQGQKWIFVEGSEAGFPMSEAMIESKGNGVRTDLVPPRLPLDEVTSDWREERLLDETGEEIFVRYKGEPSKERYEFIRDYLDFKVKRMK